MSITDTEQHLHYRVGVRGIANDFESIYTVKDSQTFSLPGMQIGSLYRVSAAFVNSAGVMGMFSNEVSFYSSVNSTSIGDTLKFESVNCSNVMIEEIFTSAFLAKISIEPNPFNEVTQINIEVNDKLINAKAVIVISDILGRQVDAIPILLKQRNKVFFSKPELQQGVYFCSLIIGRMNYKSEKMVIAE